jgi:serine/threonine protein kinase
VKVTDGWAVPGFIHVRELGGGASGRVFHAVDDITGTEVAIKYLSDRMLGDNTFVTRFRQESQVLSRLEDDNLVDVYQYVEAPSEGRAAIVMELVDGVSLRKLLATQGPAGPLGALVVLSGSLLAMAAAHQAGIVHHDYKPANVLVRSDGLSKVLDFGVAPRAGGALAYLAPEQWLGALPDPAADLYAATAVFFECLTGRPPYPVESSAALERAHRSDPIPIESVPGPLRGLVATGLAKDPAARPSSAADFLGALEDAAVEAYGPAWETQGRSRLAEMAALASMTAWTPPTAPPASPQAPSQGPPRGRSQGPPPSPSQPTGVAAAAKGGSHRAGMLIGIAAVVAIAIGVVTTVALSGGSSGTSSQEGAGTPLSPAPPARTADTPVTPDGLAAQISKAVAGKKTASFTYRRTSAGNDATSATGVLRYSSKASTAYDMTLWNPAGGADSSKKLRTILIGGVAYVSAGGWHAVPAVRTPAGKDVPHVYGSLAANTRWATSSYNILALLHASKTVKPAARAGAAAKTLSYSGVASPAKLGQDQMVGPLYTQYTGGRFKISYTLKIGADHLPQRLDVKLQSVAAPNKQTIFRIAYSHWGRKATITTPTDGTP